jgi:hypothetical protein
MSHATPEHNVKQYDTKKNFIIDIQLWLHSAYVIFEQVHTFFPFFLFFFLQRTVRRATPNLASAKSCLVSATSRKIAERFPRTLQGRAEQPTTRSSKNY